MEVSSFNKSHVTSNYLRILEVDDNKYLLKEYTGADANHHFDYEKSTLVYWAENDINVPQVFSLICNQATLPYIVIEFLKGQTLQEALEGDMTITEKLILLEDFFHYNFKRHQLALQSNDLRLLHKDMNTGNVMVANDQFYYIDFESGFRNKEVPECIGIELMKLIRWASRDMGKPYLLDIVRLILARYASIPIVINLMTKRVTGQPLQGLQRWKDNRKHRLDPNDVTKYDIVDCIASLS